MIRILLAFIFTPLVLQIPYLIPPYEAFTFWWFRLEATIMYITLMLFGVPLVWLFVRKRWISPWHSVLAGVLAGALFVVLWWLMTSTAHMLLSGTRIALSALVLGAVGGLVFWAIAFWRNPRFNAT